MWSCKAVLTVPSAANKTHHTPVCAFTALLPTWKPSCSTSRQIRRKYSMFPPEQEEPVCLLTNPPQKYAIYLIILTAHLAMTLCGCAGLRFFLANVPNNNQSPAAITARRGFSFFLFLVNSQVCFSHGPFPYSETHLARANLPPPRNQDNARAHNLPPARFSCVFRVFFA